MSPKKKIVILIDWYLPGTKAGGPVRSIYSLVSLLKDEFDFFILTSNRDLGSESEYKEVIPNTLFRSDDVNYYYFSPEKLNEKNILETIRTIEPSLVYINSFWSYPYSVSIIRARKKNILKFPVLLAPRGMLSPGALSLKWYKKKSFLFLSRLFGWHKEIPFHATNRQEENEIRQIFPDAKIRIAPNLNAITPLNRVKEKNDNEINLFYLSRIARVKNLQFALEVLAGIKRDIYVTYDIFGNIEDTAYWDQCLKIISKLPQNIKVSYKGELRFDQVQEEISKYHALFLPTMNENFGHSIVESLSSGCVALISDQTPWNDLSAFEAGKALPLSEKRAFKNEIEALAKLSQTDFQKRSENAITYISTKLNLAESRQQYISLFNESIKN